ncbi:integrator complex subunit 12 isoform X2 [Venturia canescens]|uniref:integrator complex subunit 12 isoform X2 n=1 Tax=Venturia canescens TaxID=32260 RepID=UPI001C9C43C8|nr:integrator complex subunit 12 isoform X2 [Venturia canescens]
MSQLEPDPQFIQGLRLLHSSNKDSADQLRSLLDEAIKQKYGLTKMLCNVLHKKYTMEEPVLSDHSSSGSSKKSKSSSSKHSSKSSKSGSPEDRVSRDTPPDILQSDDNLALEILEDDLTCVICKGMDVGARNRLVECVDCHSLYHQECHVPPIQDSQIDVPRLIWYCSNCLKSHQPAKERNSPKTVTEGKSKEPKKSSTSSKHTEKYKNPSSQSQSLNGAGNSSLGNSLPKPNIHIIAGDRRLKDMSKKSKQEKRGGSSSANSSGKHSSSSSSSGKSSQEKSHKTKGVAD